MKIATMAIPAALLLSACAPKRALIIHTDIPPQSPTVVVIPNWLDASNIQFASEVEAAVMRAGVAVLERPGLKLRETTKTEGVGSMTSMDGVSARGPVAHSQADAGSVKERIVEIDWDAVYKDSPADYILITYNFSPPLIRLVRREGKRVVASIQIDTFGVTEPYSRKDASYLEQKVYSGLLRLGLTKEKPEQACPKLDMPAK
jgi:hypothetical protein